MYLFNIPNKFEIVEASLASENIQVDDEDMAPIENMDVEVADSDQEMIQQEEEKEEWLEWTEDPYSKEKEIILQIILEELDELREEAMSWTIETVWDEIKKSTDIDIESVLSEYNSIAMTCPYACIGCMRRNLYQVMDRCIRNPKRRRLE